MVAVQNLGDVDEFLAELNAYWEQVYREEDDRLPDDWYWHGNEPDIHYAYLASSAGYWSESAEPIRWIMANRYADSPVGLDGNDDGGTLSAWYLFSAIGLFPIAGTDEYAVGSPIFERVEIEHSDSLLVVRTQQDSPNAQTPVMVYRDDVALETMTIRHDELVSSEWLFRLE